MSLYRRKLLIITGALALAVCGIGSGQENYVDRTYDIKAAYVYNFGKYVSWPEQDSNLNSTDDFVIGLVGESPLSQSLAKVASQKTISGRKIRIEHIAETSKAIQCDLLFFPQGQSNPLFQAIAQAVEGKPNLLVGDHPGFATRGGMINFYMEDNKVKFEINTTQAKGSGLSISSKLLRLGRALSPPENQR